MTPKLEGLAGYIAALIAIKNELPSEPEIRAELGLAMQRFQAELKSAQKKREAPQRGHLPFNGQQPISAPSTHL